jgi:hypothetical protein
VSLAVIGLRARRGNGTVVERSIGLRVVVEWAVSRAGGGLLGVMALGWPRSFGCCSCGGGGLLLRRRTGLLLRRTGLLSRRRTGLLLRRRTVIAAADCCCGGGMDCCCDGDGHFHCCCGFARWQGLVVATAGY